MLEKEGQLVPQDEAWPAPRDSQSGVPGHEGDARLWGEMRLSMTEPMTAESLVLAWRHCPGKGLQK